VAVSECGLTQGTYGGPDVGWQTLDPNLLVAVAHYMESLRWYNKQLVAVPECVGCATYDWGGTRFGWGTFEHVGISHLIEQIKLIDDPAPPPEPPEPPPNGGDPMVKIYDFNNNPFDPNATTRDWPWLYSIFGPDLRVLNIEEKGDVELQLGDIIYKVVWLDCKVGETGVGIHVEDVNGNAEQGKLPIFGWSDAEEHGLPQIWALWSKNGVYGPTNAEGDVHPGMGTGAYYDWTKIDPETGKPECGPHFVYVWDLPSDAVYGIGMLTWHPDVEGNHLHVNIGYRAEIYEGEEPPSPPPPPPEPPPEPPPDDSDLLAEFKKLNATLEEGLKVLKGIRWPLRWVRNALAEGRFFIGYKPPEK